MATRGRRANCQLIIADVWTQLRS